MQCFWLEIQISLNNNSYLLKKNIAPDVNKMQMLDMSQFLKISWYQD